MRDMKRANSDAHKEIGQAVGGIRKLLISLLVAGLAGLVAIVSYITGQVDAMRSDINKIDDKVDAAVTEQKGDAREGFELARGLRRDVEANKTELRKRLHKKE